MPETRSVDVVKLEEFEAIAQIEGDSNGEAVNINGAWILQGCFALSFASKFQSEFVNISPESITLQVEQKAGSWFLVKSQNIIFKFLSGREIRFTNGKDPEFVSKTVSVSRILGESSPVRISLDDLTIGIRPNLIPSNKSNTFHYATPTGLEFVGLVPERDPELKTRGFWVKPNGNDFILKCGTLNSEVILTEPSAAKVRIKTIAKMEMDLPVSENLIDKQIINQVLRVSNRTGVGACAEIELMEEAETKFLSMNRGREQVSQTASIDKIDISGSWLAATKFASDRGITKKGVTIARNILSDDKSLGYTRMSAADHDSIRFYLWTDPETSPQKDKENNTSVSRAIFVYHDPKVYADQTTLDRVFTQKDRYTGLRIRGLGHVGAKQIKFDGDWIYASFIEENGKAVFHFEGGQENVAIPNIEDRIGSVGLIGEDATILKQTLLYPKPNSKRDGKRISKIPTGGVMAVDLGGEGSGDSLSFSTRVGKLCIKDAKLYGPPMGVTAKLPNSSFKLFITSGEVETKDWSLQLPENKHINLDVLDDGVFPEARQKWTEPFRGNEQIFEYMEYPGSGITMDPDQKEILHSNRSGAQRTRKKQDDHKTKVTVREASDQEMMVYTQVFTNLSYRLISAYLPQSDEVSLRDDQVTLNLMDVLRDPTPQQPGWFPSWIPRNYNVDDLLVVYFCGDSAPASMDSKENAREAFIEFLWQTKFIDFQGQTRADASGKKKVVWPFLPAIALTLAKRDEPDKEFRYFWDIATDKDATALYSGIAFDLSVKGGVAISGDDPALPSEAKHPNHIPMANMGWDLDNSFKQLAKEFPMIWPQGGDGTSSKRIDPRNKRWRGILFRDMPMELNLPEALRKSKLFKGMADVIEKRLVMQFGWKDESGSTWSAKLDASSLPLDERRITPRSWDGVFEIYLESFFSTGVAGKPLKTGGKLLMKMPKIQVGEEGEKEPFTIRTDFSLNLQDEVKLERIEVSVNDFPDVLPTVSIPGFDQIGLTGLVTDLKTAGLSFNFFPTVEFAEALPFLKGNKPLKASINFNFESEVPVLDLAFLLPSEEETNLFGKWPYTIQGIKMHFAGPNGSTLRLQGTLNLGGASFVSVGLELILTRNGGSNWKLKCLIDSLGGRIDLGDGFYLAGGLYWREKPPENWDGTIEAKDIEVPKSDVHNAAGRDLWGYIDVRTKAFGDAGFYLRISDQGESSFWVGALRLGADIPLGFGELQKPFFLLARNADRKDTRLSEILSDVTKPISGNLRIDDTNEAMEWLSDWQYSKNIGLLFAGSGYMHVHDQLAKSTQDTNDPKLTSLAFTDSGIMRVDAFCNVLDFGTVNFAVGIDFRQKRFSIGFQLPGVKYPNARSPTFELSPGFLGIGFGFKGKMYLKGSLGWPLSGEDTLEPDWDRAVKVHWGDAWPINTFWGGILTETEISGERIIVRMGVAVRAGWTRTYSEGFRGVASASASLGIAIGGSVIYRFRLGREEEQLVELVSSRATHIYESTIALSMSFRAGVCKDWLLKSEYLISQDNIDKNVRETASDDLHAALVVQAAADILDEDVLALNSNLELAMAATLYADAWGSASVEFLGVTIAAISIRARAAFRICGDTTQGITEVYAVVGFEVSVEILCVTYTTEAELDLYLVDNGGCSATRNISPPLSSISQRYLES